MTATETPENGPTAPVTKPQSRRDWLEVQAKRANRKAVAQMADDDRRWFIAEVPPQKEFVAQHLLAQHGVTAFLPLELKKLRPTLANPTVSRSVARPAAPRYLFISFEPPTASGVPSNVERGTPTFARPGECWFTLYDRRIISSVVGVNNCPLPIKGRRLLQFVDTNGVHIRPVKTETDTLAPIFEPDTVVEALSGPFEGHTLKVENVLDNTVHVLGNVFGREINLTFSVDNLKRVA